MKRPSFQFYTADWRGNTKLRGVDHASRGIWIDVMCLLHDSDEYGVLRWELSALATAVPCHVRQLHNLVSPGILKGASSGQMSAAVYYRDTDQQTHVVLAPQPGPIWFSSRMLVDEFKRNRDRLNGAKGGNPALKRHSPRKRLKAGVNPLGYPSSTSPPTSISDLNTNPTATGPPRESVKEKNSTLQARVMAEIWNPKWAAAHFGENYSPGKVDYVKLAEILNQIGAKRDEKHAIERFSMIADTALAHKEEYGWEGHRLPIVHKHIQSLISDTAKRIKGRNNRAGVLQKAEEHE